MARLDTLARLYGRAKLSEQPTRRRLGLSERIYRTGQLRAVKSLSERSLNSDASFPNKYSDIRGERQNGSRKSLIERDLKPSITASHWTLQSALT